MLSNIAQWETSGSLNTQKKNCLKILYLIFYFFKFFRKQSLTYPQDLQCCPLCTVKVHLSSARVDCCIWRWLVIMIRVCGEWGQCTWLICPFAGKNPEVFHKRNFLLGVNTTYFEKHTIQAHSAVVLPSPPAYLVYSIWMRTQCRAVDARNADCHTVNTRPAPCTANIVKNVWQFICWWLNTSTSALQSAPAASWLMRRQSGDYDYDPWLIHSWLLSCKSNCHDLCCCCCCLLQIILHVRAEVSLPHSCRAAMFMQRRYAIVCAVFFVICFFPYYVSRCSHWSLLWILLAYARHNNFPPCHTMFAAPVPVPGCSGLQGSAACGQPQD